MPLLPDPIFIESINIGRLADMDVAGKRVSTGIYKHPVVGAIDVSVEGLKDDAIGDKARHGGLDQAVYLFASDDLQWWAGQRQCEILPGHFGENLTINHWWPDVRVGDLIHAGALALEVTFPRIPCAKLAARMQDAHFLKEFVASGRSGVYARVVSPGRVEAGNNLPLCRHLIRIRRLLSRSRSGTIPRYAIERRCSGSSMRQSHQGPGP